MIYSLKGILSISNNLTDIFFVTTKYIISKLDQKGVTTHFNFIASRNRLGLKFTSTYSTHQKQI